MALSTDANWVMSVSMRDNNGKVATFSLYFASDQTVAEMDSNVLALYNQLPTVSDAQVAAISYMRQFVEMGPINPAATSEVERKLVIPLGTANALPGVTSVEIPSPIFGLEAPGTDVIVPQPATGLGDLVLFLTSGLATPGNGPQTYYGEDLTRVGTITVQHRRRKPRK